MKWCGIPAALVVVAAMMGFAGCRVAPTPTPTPSVVYSAPELKYRLIAEFGEVFYCDPDFYPIGRPEQEEKNAQEQFPAIRADRVEFAAILAHLGLPGKADYTDAEKLSVYREHKKLDLAVELTPSGAAYVFSLRVGEGQGERIRGTITRSGGIEVTDREASFNTCPICLAEGTLIDTPAGPLPVEALRAGMTVWTLDGSGQQVAGVVMETRMTPVPASFQVVRVTLDDGRSVTASPGHPTAQGRPLGELHAGDVLDGATVLAVDRVPYAGDATYDILPSGPTGAYWADGILLKSTLSAP